jgi:hypothetical protein
MVNKKSLFSKKEAFFIEVLTATATYPEQLSHP